MAALPYPAYGYGAAETVCSGMRGLPDGGFALSGLRLWAAETACADCRMAASPYPTYGYGAAESAWPGTQG